MTKTTDMTEEQELAQLHPLAWSIVFGDEDPTPYLAQDAPGPPAPRSSAAQHAGKVKAGEAEARQAQRMAQLKVAAQRRQDERSADEVDRLIAQGQDVSPKLAAAAMRHLRRQGGLGLSTAQQLAARRR